MRQGVLVGCDQEQEWLLKWWWNNFRKHNRYRVAFVDFGMSEEAKAWCKSKGDLIKLDIKLPVHLVKPLAFLQSPFRNTVWIDLDCEITGSIAPIFQKIHAYSGVALVSEPGDVGYNSGVVAFEKDSVLISRWAEACLQHHMSSFCQNDLLGFVILHEEIEIAELPSKYNWRFKNGVNHEAVIIHWQGEWGKEVLRRTLDGVPGHRL